MRSVQLDLLVGGSGWEHFRLNALHLASILLYMLMYRWSLSSETRLPLYISRLTVCIWFTRQMLEMDAMRKTHDVHAAELSEQVIKLQVKLLFMCLIWAALHLQCKEA